MTMNTQNNFDLFISYAHVDDLSIGGSTGFITKFCEAISILGRIRLGREISYFRDINMSSGTDWAPEISRALSCSKIFVPVISPSWQTSTYADLEWQTFKKQFLEDLKLGTGKPVFPILFEIDIKDLGTEIRKYHINHRFSYSMNSEQFGVAVHAAVSELVKRLSHLDESARLEQLGEG